MALTKANMINRICEAVDFERKASEQSVEKIIDIIKSTLESGEDVMISGFGKFCVNQKKTRKGRNPATGAEMMLAPRKVVTFKCSGKLKAQMNKKKR